MLTRLRLHRASRLFASRRPRDRAKALNLMSKVSGPASAAAIIAAVVSLGQEESKSSGSDLKEVRTLLALGWDALERANTEWPSDTKRLVEASVAQRSNLSLLEVRMLERVKALAVLIDTVSGKYGFNSAGWGV